MMKIAFTIPVFNAPYRPVCQNEMNEIQTLVGIPLSYQSAFAWMNIFVSNLASSHSQELRLKIAVISFF